MNITLNIRQLSGDTLTLTDVPRRLTVANLKKRIENHLTAENRAQWTNFIENGCIPLGDQQSVASFKHHSNTILHFGEFDSREDTESLTLVILGADVNYNAIESKKIYAVTSSLSGLKTQDYVSLCESHPLIPMTMLISMTISFGIILASSLTLSKQTPSDDSTRYKTISTIAASGSAFLACGYTLFCKTSHWASLKDPNDSEQTEASALLPRPATAPGNGGSIN